MLLITGGLLAFAVLALIGAFLVALGGKKSVKPTTAVQAIEVQPEQSVSTTRVLDSELEIGEQATEKRPAISSFHRQRLSTRSQTSGQLEQLDFPDHPIPTYISISRNNTVSDFTPHPETSISERWSLEPSPYAERDVTALKRQLYELAGQLHLLQHKSRAIEQRVLEISSILERLDNESAAKSAMNDSSSQISYNG